MDVVSIKKCFLYSLHILLVLAVSVHTAAGAGISTNLLEGWPKGPEISAASAVLLEDPSQMVLYAKDMDEPQDPGSIVKIMTVLLALENSSLTDEVTMTPTGVEGVTDGGLSISSQLGEVFTMEECLYAVMLASANDVALQIAESVGGTVDQFVRKMNQKAAELGCTDTVFVNPTGLPAEGQHSTAHDMALIMQAAISNEDFVRIANAGTYTIPATNMSGGERVLVNNFTMLDRNSEYYNEYIIGGKQGYTESSGATLVCAARKDGRVLVCALLQGEAGETEADALALLNYGFESFQPYSFGDKDFDIVSGGDVLIPVGFMPEDLRTEDREEGGGLVRTYYAGDVPVGTARIELIEDSGYSEATAVSDANMDEAKQFSEEKSPAPYYIIGASGAALLLIVILLMVRSFKKG